MASAHKTKCRLSSGRIALLPAHATDLCHVEACNVPVQARRNRAAAAKRTDEVIFRSLLRNAHEISIVYVRAALAMSAIFVS